MSVRYFQNFYVSTVYNQKMPDSSVLSKDQITAE